MRTYKSYQEYLDHQASKLKLHLSEVIEKNREYQEIVYDRYRDLLLFKGCSVLCLGARLGGEVEAFKKLGAVAIGIDINPGVNNLHVLYGDFHEINFPDRCFDYVFTNCVDHVYDMEKFLYEISRVLKSDGIGIIELAVQEAGEYETIDTRDITDIRSHIRKYFRINFESPIDNGWQGKLLILKR